MTKLLYFFGTLLSFCFMVLIAYFLFQWIKYDVIKKETIELFVSYKWFLVIATLSFVVTAFLSGWSGVIMMTEFKFKGIFIIALQVLFLLALVFMYKILI
ncbi:MAG: hypothetical protein K6E20_06545 [Acholeplasmatales bacterium]|nr:hypothetical protein [Acholeplasmatales bacterium]